MATIRHRVGISGDAAKVFRAISDPARLAGWWPTTATGSAACGEQLELGFGGVITLSFVVIEAELDRSLTLLCPDGPGPWRGSELRFLLEKSEEQTFVTLVHNNAAADDDDFLYFNTKWPLYLLSLRDLIETGAGRPSPNDIPIFVGDTVTSNTT